MPEEFQTQARICPKCHDDHLAGSPCENDHHNKIKELYTDIVETNTTRRGVKKYRVDFKVNHQRFTTCQDRKLADAKWYQEQLTKALCYMIEEQSNPT